MVSHGVSWCLMVSHNVSWCLIMCHNVSWCLMVSHSVSNLYFLEVEEPNFPLQFKTADPAHVRNFVGLIMSFCGDARLWNTDTRNSRFTFCVHFAHQLFKKFFDTNHSGDPSKDTAYIMTIEGRAYPIDVHYLKRLVPCLSVCVD